MDRIDVSYLSQNELLQLFECKVSSSDFYDVLAYHISKNDPEYFLDRLSHLEEIRAAAAVFSFGVHKVTNPKIHKTLISLLSDSREAVVCHAVNALYDLSYFDDWEEVKSLKCSKFSTVRCAYLRFARGRFGESSIPLLMELATDPAEMVRCGVVDELEAIGTSIALQEIKCFLTDCSRLVRKVANQAILALE